MTAVSWRTIEAGPAIFYHLMVELGVKGLSVVEIFSLFEGAISPTNEPVGLILCLPFNDYVPSTSASAANAAGAEAMYFCNQVIANACGTIALLHVIMNVNRDTNGPQCPGFELGPELTRHLEFVEPLKPSVRGLCVSNDMFLRRVHNGFGNLPAPSDFDDASAEPEQPPSTRPSSSSKRKKSSDPETDTTALDTITQRLNSSYHFVALIPFNGHLWELDGLRAQPTDLGELPPPNVKPWYNVALDSIASRIDLDNPPDLSLLAIVPDPVPVLTSKVQGIPARHTVETTGDQEQQDAERELRHEQEVRRQYANERTRAHFNYLPFFHMTAMRVVEKQQRADTLASNIADGYRASEDKQLG